jgi:hypothetical protein
MRQTSILVGFGGLCVAALLAVAGSSASTTSDLNQAIAQDGVNTDLVSKLRAKGPTALESLFQRKAELKAAVATERDDGRLRLLSQQIARLDEMIDQVGMQRYCSQSRLYWYTDFEAALQAAQSTGKPILSLRMLGKLNEDYSCANSRFFRTTLYANADISSFLREHFILHWKSVRPVPKVTIDFGDGRKLERTLTGNSIHYILTPHGDLVDGLPGLYGPKAFLEQIRRGHELAKRTGSMPTAEQGQALVAHHQSQLMKLESEWQADLARAGVNSARFPESRARAEEAPQAPAANVAAAVARPKMIVEAALVRGALPLATDPMQLDDDQVWQSIAALHSEEARLDQSSRDLIRSQNPTAAQAVPLAETKLRVENPLVRMVRTLEESIAVDTVKNEYRLHREIHRWLGDPQATAAEVETLNERVYAELFLTPSSDPWLGLAPADVYTALPNAGVAKR